jgi:hypothetical protein
MRNLFYILKSHLKTPQYILKNIVWRFPKTISQLEVVFIMGTPRSGTTLLQKTVEAHTSLFSIEGETAIFSFQNFWEANRFHFRLEKEKRDYYLNQARDNVDFFSKCVNYLSSLNSNKIFVEKTPQHIKHLGFLIKHFPKAKFVHIVRDGRDCFCSARLHPFIPQSKSIITFSKYYDYCLKQGIEFYDHEQVYTLKYEDFVADPKQHLKKLMNFMNLKLEDQQLMVSSRSSDKRAKLNQFNKLNEPISNVSVERWRNELSKNELKRFNTYSKKVLCFFGYPLS